MKCLGPLVDNLFRRWLGCLLSTCRFYVFDPCVCRVSENEVCVCMILLVAVIGQECRLEFIRPFLITDVKVSTMPGCYANLSEIGR